MKNLFAAALLLFATCTNGQVKIGDNPNTINVNSLLEMESTNKGFLPPRVALNNLTAVAPLTGTVPVGMLVFSSGGTLTDGYYYWTSTEWKRLGNGEKNMVAKTANATLTKAETFIIGSNDITLTLPTITVADNGLEITIKNMGSHTDLITVAGNGGAVIDGNATSQLTRYVGLTYVASGTNWMVKETTKKSGEHIMNVGTNNSWVTIQEAIDFLNIHMTSPVMMRLEDDDFPISETITIDLPYALTIQGLSYGSVTISAASGLAGKPMFRCISESYFKMLVFDATTLSGYGINAGEDAIRLAGSGTYHEIKDCTFDRFYNTILDSSDAELWVFECDISNSKGSGILIHSSMPGVKVRLSETDFINCAKGVNMEKGSNATIQLISGAYLNSLSTDTAIKYKPATFTNPVVISITGNSWNNIGKYIEGFDFTRSDGRDANVILESNAGVGDSKPKCYLNVVNSAATTYLAILNTWYKINWGTGTTYETTKWTIDHNKITYQPVNKRNGWIIISGNVQVDANAQNLTVGIVKNGNVAVQYGATTIRVVTGDQPFPFSIAVYLSNISASDYFELYVKNETSSMKTVRFQDIQWLVTTQ